MGDPVTRPPSATTPVPSAAPTIGSPHTSVRAGRPWLGRAIAWGSPLLALYLALATFLSLHHHPRTDDANLRANIVAISANVSGYVSQVDVVDNQPVKQGDMLFVIDRRPFELAELEAESKLRLVDLEILEYQDKIIVARAAITEAEAAALYAEQYLARIEPLLAKQFVTPDDIDRARRDVTMRRAAVQERRASLAAAENALGESGGVNVRRSAVLAMMERARLDLADCEVRSPVDGFVTNMNISPGTYLKAGDDLFAVVDGSQWFVLANYQETDLRRIAPGMKAKVYLMAYPEHPVEGFVQGIAWALELPYVSQDGVLPSPEPMLDWVVLAQRFPVRITLPTADLGRPYRMGATATVIIEMDQRGSIPPWVERILPDWIQGLPLMPDRPPATNDL